MSFIIPFISQTIGGVEVKFAKISPREKAKILADIHRNRRNQLVANLEATGVDKDQRFAELEVFDDKPMPGEKEFGKYVSSPEGQADVLLRSLQAYHAADAENILDAFDEWPLGLAAQLCNLTVTRSVADEDKGNESGAEPNPTGNPPAYQSLADQTLTIRLPQTPGMTPPTI